MLFTAHKQDKCPKESQQARQASVIASPVLAPKLSVATPGSPRQDNPAMAKPNEASADAYHECSTGLPMRSPNMAVADLTLPRLVLWPQWLVKDDVFLGQAHEFSFQHPRSAPDLCPTPCLSPVTSPSDFLYDHEPLFDGIEDINEDHLPTEPAVAPPVRKASIASSEDLDWFKLLDELHQDAFDMPTPSPTTSENEESGDEGDEADTEEADNSSHHSLKRKRASWAGEAMRQRMHRLTLSHPEDNNDDDGHDHENDDEDDDDDDYDGGDPCRAQDPSHMPSSAGSRKRSKTIRKKKQPHRRRRSGILPVDHRQTVFEQLTEAGIDWCRYCGTTEGVNWRPGPWGKRTLCNKHGCDYKGYGLASRLPRLDLSAYTKEELEDRRRPIVQQFCVICQLPHMSPENQLIPCEGGCSRAYHQHCHASALHLATDEDEQWCCGDSCRENRLRSKVVVDLPRKHLPLMRISKSIKSSPALPDFSF